MGQAKLRGTQDQRVAEAKKRKEELQPYFIVCNSCKRELKDIVPMDTRGMTGIEAVFAAHCPDCKHDTWAAKGTDKAVAALFAAMGNM